MLDKILCLSNDNKLYFINDKNQKIRWIFPRTLKYPTFLNLYNTNSLKGFIYHQVIKTAFKLHIQKYFVSGVMTGELNIKFKQVIKTLECTNYSIFTGTAGENRKVIIEVNDGKNTKYFIKIPTTESAKQLVQKERINLEFLKQFDSGTFNIPKVAFFDEEVVAISNIKPHNTVKTDNFSELHFKVLAELYQHTSKQIHSIQVNLINQSITNIKRLEQIEFNLTNELDIKIKKVKSYLVSLKKLLTIRQEIIVSFSHNDFTPWNMYCTRDKLCVYDWELASDNTPLLFDFFHYIFQQGVLVKHKSYKEIKEEINTFLNNKNLQIILKEYQIDINEYYGYYLMINVSYYALKYFYQKELHIQAYWLIDVWSDALSDFKEKKGRIFDK